MLDTADFVASLAKQGQQPSSPGECPAPAATSTPPWARSGASMSRCITAGIGSGGVGPVRYGLPDASARMRSHRVA